MRSTVLCGYEHACRPQSCVGMSTRAVTAPLRVSIHPVPACVCLCVSLSVLASMFTDCDINTNVDVEIVGRLDKRKQAAINSVAWSLTVRFPGKAIRHSQRVALANTYKLRRNEGDADTHAILAASRCHLTDPCFDLQQTKGPRD